MKKEHFNEIDEETKKVLDYILTEITAGMAMIPKNEQDKVWNDAHARCKRIINLYKDGKGLFQVRVGPLFSKGDVNESI